MIVLNDLLDYKDLKIYQDNKDFCFSLDSVLLAEFVTLNIRTKKIIDLGTGNAPIPLILSTKTKAKIIGIDIKEEACLLARKSVEYNNLSDQILIHQFDIKSIRQHYKPEDADVVISNPPYFKYIEKSITNTFFNKSVARHEKLIDLETIISSASYLLKSNGYLAMVCRPERLIEVSLLMKKYRIEPKKIQIVYPGIEKPANIILIEGAKNGKMNIKIEKPLIIKR